jgi:DNA repair ATPase RecN
MMKNNNLNNTQGSLKSLNEVIPNISTNNQVINNSSTINEVLNNSVDNLQLQVVFVNKNTKPIEEIVDNLTPVEDQMSEIIAQYARENPSLPIDADFFNV